MVLDLRLAVSQSEVLLHEIVMSCLCILLASIYLSLIEN